MSDTAGDGYRLLECSFLMSSLWAIDLILSGLLKCFISPRIAQTDLKATYNQRECFNNQH